MRMIIRSNLNSPDVEVIGDNEKEFNDDFVKFLKLISDTTSEYYMAEDNIFNKLLNCAQRVVSQSSDGCPLIFDSWSCFNSTSPGTLQMEPCPEFPLMKFDSSRVASKYCETNGSWWVHPETNRSWSNYTQCVDFEKLEFHTLLNYIQLIGLFISLVFLTISLFIFYFFDCLDSSKTTVHKNLLITLWLNSFSWIIWFYFVLNDINVWSRNGIWCRIIHAITTYITLTTYLCMLCEGIFLKLILSELSVKEKTMHYLQVLGWIVPFFITIPYIIYRLLFENNNCWIDIGKSNLFLGVPVIAVILINIILLVNVIMILRDKLTTTNNSQRSGRSQKMALKQARAILLLSPILGLNYLPFPFRPEEGSGLENIYDVMMALHSGFQGCLVSFILCFSNSEVIAAVKRRFNQYRASFV